MGATTGSMEKQDSVVGMPCPIPVRFAERQIVKPQLGKRFAGSKAEIFNGVRAILDGPLGLRRRRLGAGSENCEKR